MTWAPSRAAVFSLAARSASAALRLRPPGCGSAGRPPRPSTRPGWPPGPSPMLRSGQRGGLAVLVDDLQAAAAARRQAEVPAVVGEVLGRSGCCRRSTPPRSGGSHAGTAAGRPTGCPAGVSPAGPAVTAAAVPPGPGAVAGQSTVPGLAAARGRGAGCEVAAGPTPGGPAPGRARRSGGRARPAGAAAGRGDGDDRQGAGPRHSLCECSRIAMGSPLVRLRCGRPPVRVSVIVSPAASRAVTRRSPAGAAGNTTPNRAGPAAGRRPPATYCRR